MAIIIHAATYKHLTNAFGYSIKLNEKLFQQQRRRANKKGFPQQFFRICVHMKFPKRLYLLDLIRYFVLFCWLWCNSHRDRLCLATIIDSVLTTRTPETRHFILRYASILHIMEYFSDFNQLMLKGHKNLIKFFFLLGSGKKVGLFCWKTFQK